MLKELTTISGEDAKYFEALLLEVKPTPSNNLFLRTTDTVHLAGRSNDDIIIRTKHASPDMNFLVPRRRTILTDKILRLELNQKYVFKLVPETHSKKYTVTEVFKTRG
jgi:hypothetical protein